MNGYNLDSVAKGAIYAIQMTIDEDNDAIRLCMQMGIASIYALLMVLFVNIIDFIFLYSCIHVCCPSQHLLSISFKRISDMFNQHTSLVASLTSMRLYISFSTRICSTFYIGYFNLGHLLILLLPFRMFRVPLTDNE